MMPDEVARDLRDSAHDFRAVVWPAVQQFCGGGELIQTEAKDRELMRLCDVLAGIDAWQVRHNVGLRGIASRIQWCTPPLPRSYRTFTIRKSRDSGALTEYQKRLRALGDPEGWVYPHLTVQAYLELPRGKGSPLLAAGVARTADVIRMIRDGREGRQYTVKRTGNATFYVVEWAAMRRSDKKVCLALGDGAAAMQIPLLGPVLWPTAEDLEVAQAAAPEWPGAET